jgi:hypothetical protein
MANVILNVNGQRRTVDVDPATPLLYILRNDLDQQGPRFGCGLGQCGACTVLINGTPTRSCVTAVSTVKGEITTLDGLASEGKLHPVQQAWIDEQVPACGYCRTARCSRRWHCSGAIRGRPMHRSARQWTRCSAAASPITVFRPPSNAPQGYRRRLREGRHDHRRHPR